MEFFLSSSLAATLRGNVRLTVTEENFLAFIEFYDIYRIFYFTDFFAFIENLSSHRNFVLR